MAGKINGTERAHTERQAAKQDKKFLSVEQKLELSHLLRQEQDYNRMQMDQREMLVYGTKRKSRAERKYRDGLKSGYGRTSMLQAAEVQDAEAEAAWQKMQRRNRVSFVIRGFIAVLLFMIVLLMRFAGLKIGTVDYQNLVSSLSSEEFVNGMDFEELVPDMDKEQSMPETEKIDSPDKSI